MINVIQTVQSHHERYDGTGYPHSINGENIPLMARIINIADSYDAMTTDRPYRKAMTTEAAIAEIVQGAGKQFDPTLVRSFVELMGDKKHPKECSYLYSCSLFPKIKEKEISAAYEMQYCIANFQGCKRFIMAGEGKPIHDTLLPDGGSV